MASNDDFDEILMMPMEGMSSGYSYASMIKDLVEARRSMGSLHPDDTSSIGILDNLNLLLKREVEYQLMLQDDVIKQYKANKAQEELKSNNVTPIKKK